MAPGHVELTAPGSPLTSAVMTRDGRSMTLSTRRG